MKKLLAVILSIVTIFGALSVWGGCGQKNEPDMTFSLTESDYEEFEETVNKFTDLVATDGSVFKVVGAMSKMTRLSNYFETQYYIALVDYHANPTNQEKIENYKTAYSYYSKSITGIRTAVISAVETNEEWKETIFEGLTEEEINQIISADNSVIEALNDSNLEIELEYDALEYGSAGWGDKVNALYDDYVSNNNAIAKEYGFTDFYTLAADEYGRDYDADDRALFRGYVAEYIVPLYFDVKTELEENKAKLDDKQKILFTVFNDFKYDTLRADYIGDYVETLTGTAKPNMKAFFTDKTVTFADGEDSIKGAFTAYLGEYSMPLAYFGPDYQDILTVVHEMGHYSAFYNYGTELLTLDLIELHSQGNEWLFISYLDGKMDEELYNVIFLNRLLYGVRGIIKATIVDEFEESVYTADVPYASTDFDELMKSICLKYGNVYDEFNLGNYYKRVVIGQPAYYGSYATSEVCAINLYLEAEDDYIKAVETYRALQEDVDTYLGFSENLSLLGIDSPFEEQPFINVKTAFDFS